MDHEFVVKKKGSHVHAQQSSARKGFTLVEILVVLGIIGIIVFVGVSSYGVVRKKMQLDIAASTVQSMITQAREKARAGYFESGGDDTTSSTYCFGFRVEVDGFIDLLQSSYNRIAETKKCFSETDPKVIKEGENEGNIIVKKINAFGQDVDSFEEFFEPPYAEIEIQPGISNSKVRIIVGREDSILSEDPLDHREIILDVLSGSVKAKRYDPEEDVQSLFN